MSAGECLSFASPLPLYAEHANLINVRILMQVSRCIRTVRVPLFNEVINVSRQISVDLTGSKQLTRSLSFSLSFSLTGRLIPLLFFHN